MSNNNEYYDYEFEPVDRNDPYIEPRKPKKNRTALKVVALALVCALAGGLGGGALTTLLANRQEAVVEEDAQPASGEAEIEEKTPAKTNEDTGKTGSAKTNATSIAIRTNTNDKVLTPKEVYNQNVNAVAGINVTGTTMGTNIWGYATPFAASGSGFVISPDGYVVTNNHVIENADEIKVSLYDGSSYDAELVGTFAENDVALLKVDGKDLPCVSIGDSDKLEVGDEVIAIGNPLGQLTFTMTAGYVSALDRTINIDGNPINMLQTDAAINSGNSGGPLFDMSGSVIGITTAKSSRSAYSSGASIEGIGFAVPINDVMSIVNDLKEVGYVTGRAYLGITPKDLNLDEQTASYYNLPLGVYVDNVTEGSCAEKAGMKEGDIITKLGGYEVDSYASLKSALNHFRAGDEVEIEVYRDGKIQTLKASLDERPREPEKPSETQPETEQQQPQQVNPFGSNGDAYRDPFAFFFGF